MTTLAYTVPTPGTDQNAIADPEIATALTAIKAWANGNIDAVNLSALLAQSVGANQNAQTVKGATNIVTSESRTNVAYGLMPTPDQVTGIVLPANGLIRVWYQATWQESVNGAARAAIFLNANQLRTVYATATPNVVQEAKLDSVGTAVNRPLNSFAGGLNPDSTLQFTPTDKPETGPVTTGQVVGGGTISGTATNLVQGGACDIFAAAGTYTVSVQFKASSGSVTVANRKLWVQALAFS